MEFNRRATDRPEVIERVVALETNINNVKDAVTELTGDLRSHIRDESSDVGNLTIAIERLSANQETQTRTLERVADTLQTVAVHSARVQSLEDWRDKTEGRLDEVTSKVAFIFRLAAITVPVGGAVWAIVEYITEHSTFFK